jgi:hypothetical protein
MLVKACTEGWLLRVAAGAQAAAVGGRGGAAA